MADNLKEEWTDFVKNVANVFNDRLKNPIVWSIVLYFIATQRQYVYVLFFYTNVNIEKKIQYLDSLLYRDGSYGWIFAGYILLYYWLLPKLNFLIYWWQQKQETKKKSLDYENEYDVEQDKIAYKGRLIDFEIENKNKEKISKQLEIEDQKDILEIEKNDQQIKSLLEQKWDQEYDAIKWTVSLNEIMNNDLIKLNDKTRKELELLDLISRQDDNFGWNDLEFTEKWEYIMKKYILSDEYKQQKNKLTVPPLKTVETK